MPDKINIAVLVSGGGTNLQALIDAEKSGIIRNGEIKLVLSSNAAAYALERAKENNIPTAIVTKKEYGSMAAMEQKMISVLDEYKIDLIVLAGFMCILSENFTKKYDRRILNVHPSLIPSFCGEGFYGLKVHEAALQKGVKVTGATVHFVNEIPDGGEIILQKAVEVLPDDTPSLLQARVMREAEWIILPQAVEKVSKEMTERKIEMNIYEISPIGKLINGNPYVGRGIITGTSQNGKYAVNAYFIMGRSANSRNRIFAIRENAVFTEPFDASKVEDPSLIIYAAVREYENNLIVTNGDQTDTIYDGLKNGISFKSSLEQREFEPDSPNFTPRISSISTFADGSFRYEMNILKSIDEVGSDCARYTFSYNAKPGLGHFIHTYVTDGNPIPTFQGEPERVEIPDDIEAFTKDIWDNLNEDNKISLYVRYTDLQSGEITEQLTNKNA